MLVLFETPAGFALFKVLDEKKLKHADKIHKEFVSPEKAQGMVSLQAFHKFENITEALASAAALNESKVGKSLKRLLKKSFKKSKDKLAVSDSKLAKEIKETVGVSCVSNMEETVNELMRGIRNQISSLVSGLSEHDINTMALGLSHSLSRYKLKFSPDKVDTMIVQAIGLLDDLDKELNTYAMRVKEWYGWHFPELAKILPDNQLYAKTIKVMGIRSNAVKADLESILAEELAEEVRETAKISMGTEIAPDDIAQISQLCDEVLDMSTYRDELYEYLKNRMAAIAPNLTALVGELVGARLISHAGSLMNLAKHPASTVQILGAEKALFRALKTKHSTPKYGLIYHASIIGQAGTRYKGKMSRVLANKCALSIRVDALGDEQTAMIGVESREKVETRLRQLEGKELRQISGKAKTQTSNAPYDYTQTPSGKQRESKLYNTEADVTIQGEASEKKKTSEKKEKKKSKKRKDEEAEHDNQEDGEKNGKKDKKKKKKKHDSENDKADGGAKKRSRNEDNEETEEVKQKKRKKDKKQKKKNKSDSE